MGIVSVVVVGKMLLAASTRSNRPTVGIETKPSSKGGGEPKTVSVCIEHAANPKQRINVQLFVQALRINRYQHPSGFCPVVHY